MTLTDTLATVLAVWTAVAALFWLFRGIATEVAARRQPYLRPDDPAELPPTPPRLTVLVAGKDEAVGIEACVRSVLSQDYPDFEVILVNDRSGDGTGEIMDRLAAENPGKVRAFHVTELLAGWCGKNNAMRTGIAHATGEWLLMLDADCRQLTPRSFRLAVARAAATGADLLSVMAAMEPRTFWDKAVQPLLANLLMVWFNPDFVNDPARPTAYANGAFLMIRRPAYDRIGGHEAVKGEVNEDIHLARIAKAAGLRLHLTLNGGLYITRMYDDLPRMIRGWSRIFYGSFKSAVPPLVTLLLLGALSTVPDWAAIAAVALGVSSGWSGPTVTWLLPAVAAGLAVQTLVMARFLPLAGVSPVYALLYPLAAAVEAWIMVRTLNNVRLGGGITWRGTTYGPTPGR
jgi:hypothetical protein